MAGADAAVTLTARVHKVVLEDGGTAARKIAAPNAPVTREAVVLRFLHSRGCPVPRVLAADETTLLTEWAGDVTLDDALQEGGDVDGGALLAAVRSVSDALASATTVKPGAAEALAADLRRWTAALPDALGWLGLGPVPTLLGPVAERALECAPRPGSLDYNARNVVLSPSGPVLIDFSAVGYDWDERRAAQYALSAGADRPDGTFRSALTEVVVKGAWDAEGIDAHEVVLLAIAVEQLRQVATGSARRERAAAWGGVERRRESLLRLLARPLCADGPAAVLRAAIAARS
ncbi:MAG TPA: hypothetical protein VFX49_15875 [Chloroflexota bacterium]|nr:hypothetical protein [Chloroflexota bacterium]